MMNENQASKTVAAVKKAFPEFAGGDYVLRACGHARFVERFPEDMVESRTSWDELKDMFDDVCDGFQALFDLVAKLAEKEDPANGIPASTGTAE